MKLPLDWATEPAHPRYLGVMPFLRSLLQSIYVPHCPGCDARMHDTQGLCPECAISLYPLGPACPVCAEPADGPSAVRCYRCARNPPPYRRIVAPYRYGGQLAIAISRLKFADRPDIAHNLAALVTPLVEQIRPDIDIAIPVPLHWRRLASRQFNQSQLVLQLALRRTGVDDRTRALIRTRNTQSQTSLPANRRYRNLAGAFSVPRRYRPRLAHRRILLFDDVVTTGATMTAAAESLMAAGAHSVLGLCIARAERS